MLRSSSLVLVALATVVCLSFPACTWASDPLDLFGAPSPEPVKVYKSKPPQLLPERAPGQPLDLFTATPSPSVAELKAHADSRRVDVERPLVIGTLPGGVVTNYAEAYRLALRSGRPLNVLVGQQPAMIAEAKAAAPSINAIVCVLDPGNDPCFPTAGAHRYFVSGGVLVEHIDRYPQQTMSTCPCSAGGACACPAGACRCQ